MITQGKITGKLASYVAALTTDAICVALGSPPTAVFGQTLADGFSSFLESRSRAAKEILIEELSSGNRLASDVDSECFYGLLFQYLNAVKIGIAKRNLRLMAQIIREGSTMPIPFQPDEIASCAKLIADLTNDEIILLAEFKRQRDITLSIEADNEYSRVGTHNAVLAELVPKVFQTEADLFSVATALQRTGLVRMPSVWGGNRIDTTRLFDKVCKLCSF
jgi:hypothetical protein